MRIAVALAVVLVLAGCGGSAAPTRATYGKKVDKVCADLRARVKALQAQGLSSNDELARNAENLGETLDDGVRRLRAVTPPDGEDGEKARRWLDALARDNDEVIKPALADLAAAARRDDQAAVRRAAAKVGASDDPRVDALSREAGARECD